MIKQYTKKPVTIEAVQYTGDNLEEVEKFVGKNFDVWFSCLVLLDFGECLKVDKGDYIIKGIKGEFYPCKPDIFKQTYDEVI